VGAVNAHALDGILERRLAREILCHARFHVAALAAVEGLGRVEGQKPRGAGARRHLAELELYSLVLADRLAERLAHLSILRCELQRAFGYADAARRDVDAAELEAARCLIESLALDLSDQMVARNAIVLEHELGRVDRLVAELLEPA